jgi:hypothetical protein
MLPDLLLESSSGQRLIWQATTKRNFFVAVNITATPLAIPHAGAFVDVIGDPAAGEQ